MGFLCRCLLLFSECVGKLFKDTKGNDGESRGTKDFRWCMIETGTKEVMA